MAERTCEQPGVLWRQCRGDRGEVGFPDWFGDQRHLPYPHLPGSPCIYYGTEIALPGGHDPDCRRCMPWNELEKPEVQAWMEQVKRLIRLCWENRDLRAGEVEFYTGLVDPRWV